MSGRGGYLEGQDAHAWPTPLDYIDGTTTAYGHGWDAGFAAGYHAAQEDAQNVRIGAQVARAGVDALNVMHAREKAATYSGARGPARGWAA